MLEGGVVESGGGVVVPGEVDWSVELGAGVDWSAGGGGELAAPPGEADSCLEQADMSASAPTHNNRTLRFIFHLTGCNGTVAGPGVRGPTQPDSRKRRSGSSHPALYLRDAQITCPATPAQWVPRARLFLRGALLFLGRILGTCLAERALVNLAAAGARVAFTHKIDSNGLRMGRAV